MYALVVCNPKLLQSKKKSHGYKVLSTVFLPQTLAFRIKEQAPPTKMFLK